LLRAPFSGDNAVNALRFASRYSSEADTVFTASANDFASAGGADPALLFASCCGYVNPTFPQGNEEWGAFWPDQIYTVADVERIFCGELGSYP
jgi:hypothetical protein